MNSYIFITTEGYTFQPESTSIEPDIENCQVIGFAQGTDAKNAFQNLICENSYLLETNFDEIVCFEFKNSDYYEQSNYFNLDDYKTRANI